MTTIPEDEPGGSSGEDASEALETAAEALGDAAKALGTGEDDTSSTSELEVGRAIGHAEATAEHALEVAERIETEQEDQWQRMKSDLILLLNDTVGPIQERLSELSQLIQSQPANTSQTEQTEEAETLEAETVEETASPPGELTPEETNTSETPQEPSSSTSTEAPDASEAASAEAQGEALQVHVVKVHLY